MTFSDLPLFSKAFLQKEGHMRNSKNKSKTFYKEKNARHIVIWKGKLLFKFEETKPSLLLLNNFSAVFKGLNSTFLGELDGKYLEGGGQLLRNSLVFGAVLGFPLHVFDVRGGREQPGLKPSHATAAHAITSLVGAKLIGGETKSAALTFLPQGSASAHKSDMVIEVLSN